MLSNYKQKILYLQTLRTFICCNTHTNWNIIINHKYLNSHNAQIIIQSYKFYTKGFSWQHVLNYSILNIKILQLCANRFNEHLQTVKRLHNMTISSKYLLNTRTARSKFLYKSTQRISNPTLCIHLSFNRTSLKTILHIQLHRSNIKKISTNNNPPLFLHQFLILIITTPCNREYNMS